MAKLVLVNLDMNKNQLLQAVMQAGDAPANPTAGQFYYDTTKKHAYVYNGTAWELMGNIASVVDADFNANSTNAIQNKAVSTGLVKSFDSASTNSSYIIKGKAANGSEVTSTEIPAATNSAYGVVKVDSALSSDSTNPVQNKVINATLSNKVDKVSGKGLSTNDFTDAEKQQLANLVAGTITVDSALSSTSKNPVQNKVINSALGDKADKSTVNTLSGKVSTLESQMVLMPADISATGGSTSYKLTLEDADGSTLGTGATISQATSTNVGVVKLDSSVTASGVNPVTGKAIYDYVGNAIAASDAMIFKGTLGTGGTITALPTTYKTGWTYRVITAGTYAGQKCEIGDLIIALVDRAGSGNANADWTVAQTNIDGAITSISGTSPISVTGSGSSRTIAHKASGVDAGSYGEGSDKTVAFGDILSIPYISVDAIGHVTGADIDTITFPDNVVTASANGLMSSTDKIKLDEVLETKRVYDVISKGQTSVNIKLPDNAIGDILSVCAVCDNTGEEAIIDWGYRYDTAQAGYVVHCSIAQPYTEAIGITVLCV